MITPEEEMGEDEEQCPLVETVKQERLLSQEVNSDPEYADKSKGHSYSHSSFLSTTK